MAGDKCPRDKGKILRAGEGNVYAKANEVIVKITGADTNQALKSSRRTASRDFNPVRTITSKPSIRFTYLMEVLIFKLATIYFMPTKDHACIFRQASRIKLPQ